MTMNQDTMIGFWMFFVAVGSTISPHVGYVVRTCQSARHAPEITRPTRESARLLRPLATRSCAGPLNPNTQTLNPKP